MSTSTENLPHLALPYLPETIAKEASNDPDVRARITKLIQAFNRDIGVAQNNMISSVQKNLHFLINKEEIFILPLQARVILDRYAFVDTLAIHYRDKTRSAFINLLATTFLAMLTFEIFAHILPEMSTVGAMPRIVLAWLYPILWLISYGIWYHAHHHQYQKKYQDYRALAEGLRVQFFWSLLGSRDKVENYYLLKQQGELEWIRLALRHWREHDDEKITAPKPTDEQLKSWRDLIYKNWVKDQFDYFDKKAGPREERSGQRYKWLGATLFGLSLLLSLALAGCEVWHSLQKPPASEKGLPHEELILILAISVLLTGAAIVIAYKEKMAFSEHSRQYGATSILFGAADRRLKSGLLVKTEIEVLRTLGKEALQENGDWLLLHRDRPLEIFVP